MSSLKPATKIEVVSGHVVTESALTIVGALTGNPLGALLPILAKSLAGERQKKRVEDALAQVDATLSEQSAAVRDLTDAQYKLVNETILALLQTTSSEKIEYLRKVVSNSLSFRDVLPQEAVMLSRIIRDISAEEANFLRDNFGYERVQLWPLEASDDNKKVLAVLPRSAEGVVVSGLVSLGLLSGAGPIEVDIGRFFFSPIVAKLLVLFREPSC